MAVEPMMVTMMMMMTHQPLKSADGQYITISKNKVNI